MVWVIDLDGVMWLGSEPIRGSAEAIDGLRRSGVDVLFVTNNSSATIAQHEAKLARHGVDAAGAVLSSALAAAELVSPGERVLVVGGPGLREAVAGRGCELVHGPDDVDVVVSGMDRELTYETLRVAGLALRRGARYVLTNPDATYPTPHGLEPGAGALGAALRTAGGVEPRVAGKPEGSMVDLVRRRYGAEGVVVGDRPDTDGRFAAALGYRFGLVLSGVTTEADLPVEPTPWCVADDLGTLVERWSADRGPSVKRR